MMKPFLLGFIELWTGKEISETNTVYDKPGQDYYTHEDRRVMKYPQLVDIHHIGEAHENSKAN